MDDINNPPLPPEADVTSEAGTGNDSNTSVELKDLLSEATGRQFKTNEEALKATSDTFKYVGKVGKYLEPIKKLEEKTGGEGNVLKLMEELTKGTSAEQPGIDTSKFVTKDELEKVTFYNSHPEYQPVKEIIDALQLSTNKPLDEVVKLDTFKNVFDKVQAHEANEKDKSVLMTNSKLGQVTDKIEQAKVASEKGDYNTAAKSAVDAVLELTNQ